MGGRSRTRSQVVITGIEVRRWMRSVQVDGPLPYGKNGAVFGNRERLPPRRPQGWSGANRDAFEDCVTGPDWVPAPAPVSYCWRTCRGLLSARPGTFAPRCGFGGCSAVRERKGAPSAMLVSGHRAPARLGPASARPRVLSGSRRDSTRGRPYPNSLCGLHFRVGLGTPLQVRTRRGHRRDEARQLQQGLMVDLALELDHVLQRHPILAPTPGVELGPL